MQQPNTRICRSMLQLAQATYTVLEREVPESEGLPGDGLAVLRLLRWLGGKTQRAIAAFVGVPSTMMDETLLEMVRLGLIKQHSGSNSTDSIVFKLAPGGVASMRRIIAAQRKSIERSIAHLSEDQHETIVMLLETMAYELVSNSAGFGITCAECCALDVHECIRMDSNDFCAFRRAQRADFDPDLSEDSDDVPCTCSNGRSQYTNMGIGPEARS